MYYGCLPVKYSGFCPKSTRRCRRIRIWNRDTWDGILDEFDGSDTLGKSPPNEQQSQPIPRKQITSGPATPNLQRICRSSLFKYRQNMAIVSDSAPVGAPDNRNR